MFVFEKKWNACFEIWRRKWVFCVLLLIESDSTHSNLDLVVDLKMLCCCMLCCCVDDGEEQKKRIDSGEEEKEILEFLTLFFNST